MKLVLVFSTTHNALAAEAALSNHKVTLEILPTPREISVSCGISIQIDPVDLPRIVELVEAQEIRILGVYCPEQNETSGKREYTRIWGETQ